MCHYEFGVPIFAFISRRVDGPTTQHNTRHQLKEAGQTEMIPAALYTVEENPHLGTADPTVKAAFT